MRWAAAGWLKEHLEQMKLSYQLSKKKVLNAVKFGAAEHMKKGTIRQVPTWAWGGEQEIIALAENFWSDDHGTLFQGRYYPQV